MPTVVAAFLLLGGLAALAQDRPPELDQREAVAAELRQPTGIKMVLPTKLPAGYEYGKFYSYNSIDGPTGMDAQRADSREVVFFTEHATTDTSQPIVAMCVQYADAKRVLCPAPRDRVERRFRESLVTFYIASDGTRDLSPWETLELTTDLNKVTWLQ